MPEEEEEEAYEDFENFEPEEAPAIPPVKPPSIVNFFIEQNKAEAMRKTPQINEAEIKEMLRKKWKEELGKSDQQQWKRQHKKLTKRFERLLELYSNAHPEFDKAAYIASQSTQSSKQRNKNKSTADKLSARGQRKRGGYATKRQGNKNSYDIITFSDGEGNGPPSKKRRLNTSNTAFQEDTNMEEKLMKSETNNNSNNSNNDTKPLHLLDDLLQDMKKNGPRRSRKQDDDIVLDDSTKALLDKLMNDMSEAAKRDWQCNIDKKPAIHMLESLDRVKSELQKKRYFKLLLDEGLLDRLRDWLHPFPDGSLPPQKIRDDLLPIIQAFPLHKEDDLNEHLTSSAERARDPAYQEELLPERKGFAETLMNLWASKFESRENKQLLCGMINKWLYKIENANIDYGEIRDELGERKAEIMQRRDVLQKQKQDFNVGPRKRAKVPERAWFDFAVIPRSKIDESEGGPAANREGVKKSKFASFDQRFQKQKKSATAKRVGPSINGRLNLKG